MVDRALPIESGASPLHGVRRLLLAGGGVAFSLLATFPGLLVITFVIGRLMPIDPVLAVVGDLASQGIIIGTVFGIPLGVWSAVYRNSFLDHIMRVLGLIGYSVPIFWLGIMGLLVFYLQLQWVGGPGRLDVYLDGEVPTVTGMILVDSLLAGDWEVFDNAFSHIILPATLLGYYSLAYICRMTRSLMLEQLNQEYLITARVKGLSERRVIWRHAFGNIMVPLITVVALAFANILEGSVLTETVFAWPGIGRYITTALLAADMNAVLGGTIVVGMIYIGMNLLSDILYRIVDPRAR